MKLQCNRPVTVKGITIGGPAPLICLPLMAVDDADLLQQAKDLVTLGPDLLEWRIDAYEKVENVTDSIATLSALADIIGPTPLVFTCRIDAEGGARPMARETRLNVILAAIRSGKTDIVDVEMRNDDAFIDAVRRAAQAHGVKTIFSFHDFHATPEAATIVEKLVLAQDRGADIAKAAVTPRSPKDVLAMMTATLEARVEHLDIPMITISMGTQGKVTRLAGGLFGSDITFASGNVASAPGQIPVAALRQAMTLLYS